MKRALPLLVSGLLLGCNGNGGTSDAGPTVKCVMGQ